jgi:hypothetical protein
MPASPTRRRAVAVLPLAAATAIWGCGDGGTTAAEKLCDWAPTFVGELGSVEDPRSVEYGSGNSVVRRLSDGRVAVMELFDAELILYDVEGRYQRTIGRGGEGPGELGAPLSFTVGPADSLWIVQTGGRLTALAPDGSGGRTLRDRGIGVAGIADFTATGDLVFDIPSRTGPGWVDLRDREGALLRSISGGLPLDSIRVTNSITGAGGVLWQADSSYFKRVLRSADVWVERWTRDAVEPVLRRQQVIDGLAREGTTVEPDSTELRYLARDPDGSVWGLGVVRLVDLTAVRPVMPGGERGMGSSDQQNEWHDGILFRWDPASGSVRARLIDELPTSFADDTHYVTFREDDRTGLILPQLWRVPGVCPGG